VGTYRLGIVLLSDNWLSEQRLLVVDLTSDYRHDNDCVSYDTTFGIILPKYLLLRALLTNRLLLSLGRSP